MAEEKAGSLNSNVLQARLRSYNPLVRSQRRGNKKPRKQLPTQQPPTPPKVDMPKVDVPNQSGLKPNVSLDNRVERMRQPSPTPAPAPQMPVVEEDPYGAVMNILPPFDSLDRVTQAQIRGFILKSMIQNPDLARTLV